jgi:tRNA (pseudouridine54-N1)-methyltransferase
VRHFAVVGHRAPTSPDFSLEDLPGSAGRLDILVRCVTAALHVSHGIRRDTVITLLLQGPPGPPRTLRFVGSDLRGLNPDERSTAARIRNALEYEGRLEREVSPGLHAGASTLAEIVRNGAPLLVMDEQGKDLRGLALPPEPTFLLSDHEGLTLEERGMAMDARALAVSVGPKSLHADQVITLVHNELDRREDAA